MASVVKGEVGPPAEDMLLTALQSGSHRHLFFWRAVLTVNDNIALSMGPRVQLSENERFYVPAVQAGRVQIDSFSKKW